MGDQKTTTFAFVGTADLRQELEEVRGYLSERDGLPASLSDVMRAAVRLGMETLRKQRDEGARKRGPRRAATVADPVAETLPPGFVRKAETVLDPYDGPLPPGFVRKSAKKAD